MEDEKAWIANPPRTASEENPGIIAKGRGGNKTGRRKVPPARRRGRQGEKPYGRAIVMTGDCQVSRCAGLALSPSALRTVTRITYWPFGTV